MDNLNKTVKLQKNKKISNVYDVELCNVDRLKEFSSVECHIVLYPYSRNITRDNYSFNPFEEYVMDLATNKKSAYAPLRRPAKEIFGLLLGFIILLFFWEYNPSVLISVESIVGIFGAYFIGKDLWDDIEDFLVNLTKNWNIRYQYNYYRYKLDKNSTMTQYSYYAKKQRYNKNALLPDKMEFIEESNSSTARMCFDDVNDIEESAHLFSIHVDPRYIKEFDKQGFLFGVKLSLNKRFLFFERGYDIFQSLSRYKKGCLNNDGKWLENTAYYRNTLSFGKLKIFLNKGYMTNVELIEK